MSVCSLCRCRCIVGLLLSVLCCRSVVDGCVVSYLIVEGSLYPMSFAGFTCVDLSAVKWAWVAEFVARDRYFDVAMIP